MRSSASFRSSDILLTFLRVAGVLEGVLPGPLRGDLSGPSFVVLSTKPGRGLNSFFCRFIFISCEFLKQLLENYSAVMFQMYFQHTLVI